MNTDKAYILGLVIGGGCFSSDASSFYIRLPYRQWGDASKNPERAGMIANDILKVVKPLMSLEYGLDVGYTSGREWRIECYGDTKSLIKDLDSFSIAPSSELHKTADISKLIDSFGDDINMKKRFIAGVADMIGSMNPSHRRFSDDVQIISFEISGFNYRFVCQLCNLLYEVGCIPDQILWQHPNMQSGNDAYYSSWKKGNKLRVTLDSFSTFGSLAFKSKTIAARENRSIQRAGAYNQTEKCEDQELSGVGVVAVHVDENHPNIPKEIRGGHYIHHKQICGALNCPHAPCNSLDRVLKHAEKHILPFTVWHKDEYELVYGLMMNDPIMKNRIYTGYDVSIVGIVRAVEDGAQVMTFKNGVGYSYTRDNGYPLNIVLEGLSYIIASKTGELNGKRPRGSREEIISKAINNNPAETVHIEAPDLLTPILITDYKVAMMVGPLNSKVYKRLISFDDNNQYKLLVRPITEEDLL